MPRIDVRGLSVHYQQAGSGRDVVLIHGLAANLAFWYLSVVPLLAREYRVTLYDLRGHGLSAPAPTGYTTSELAADLAALLERLNIGSAHLVGHSYGGAVALHLATAMQSRVATVVAADAYVPCFQKNPGPRATLRAYAAARQLRRTGISLPAGLPRVSYGLLADLARQPHAESAPTAWQWADQARAGERWLQLRKTSTVVQDVRHPTLTPAALAGLRVPVLAAYGQHSTCAATLRGIRKTVPGVQTVTVPHSGHLHPVLHPEIFVPVVTSFIAEAERPLAPAASTIDPTRSQDWR
jgi:pimeloyl-ACP methyl ester carboxylesterase